MGKKHLTTPEILLLKSLYAGKSHFLTVKQAGIILRCSDEGARYQLERLFKRGWVAKSQQFVTYYSTIESAKMRENILKALNEVIY